MNAQALNDLLTNAVTDSASFTAAVTAASPADADLVQGIKYARNVAQHVLHVIRPSDDIVLVGGTLGMRVYACWDDIPPGAHAKLRPATRKLKPAYDNALRGREVTGTMLALLRLYGQTAPDIVRQNHRGEWTGFPLMSQPAGGSSSAASPEANNLTERQQLIDPRQLSFYG